MRLPELLAPAGSPQAARAAVQNGADAIYLGGKQFSARQFADNFAEQELDEILQYCSVYGVKVYVTVNTLVHDSEMEDALGYLCTLYNAGVDAVIMQDLGLVRATAKLLPGLAIHGSTQMTVHNSAGIEFLNEIGLKRVVLAREMSLEDINQVKEKTDMELEIFLHGALCIAYSGQCLLSSMIGGRSGNRGKCAQPCRLPYSLCKMGKGQACEDHYSHILSPKDLNLIEYLPQLIESGVAGLKIEGRMKRAEYVAVVVRTYRQALDRYAENPEDYCVTPEELQDLAQVFNREFTTGYLFGNQGKDMMSLDRPNNRGVFLGRVKKVDRVEKRVTLHTEAALSIGDEIEFWVTSGGRKEAKIGRLFKSNEELEKTSSGEYIEIELNSVRGIYPGDRVFKTFDAQLMWEARQSYVSPVQKRKIPLKLQVYLHPGKPLRLSGEDTAGNPITVSSQVLAEEAIKRPLTEDILRKQLDRMGNTPFELTQIDFDLGERVIIPVSEINKARRNLVELLEKSGNRKKFIEKTPAITFTKAVSETLKDCTLKAGKSDNLPPVISVSVKDISGAKAALAAGAGRIYVEEFSEVIADQARKTGAQVYFTLPRILQENQLKGMRHQVQFLLDKGLTGFSCANPGSFRLLNSLGANKIHADYPLNIFNKQAVCFFRDRGAESYCLSLELNMQEINQFGMMLSEAECVVHGWPPLMVSRHCVLHSHKPGGTDCAKVCRDSFGLKDRMNLTFPVKTDAYCNLFLYNSKELCMVENLRDLMEYGVRYFRIEASTHDAHYIKRVVAEYNRILKLIDAGAYADADGVAARERLEKASLQGITKGHYFRGV